MATPMDVAIVSAEAEVWRGEAEMVIARSPEGEFAILHGHIPFLAALVPGRVTVVSGESRDEYFVPGGFLEASRSRPHGSHDAEVEQDGSGDYHVIVLADDAEELDSIDAEGARRRLEEAQRKREEDSDDTTEARLRVEMARVEIAESRGQ